jgi:endonuclease YncB( thermonuclease family)
MNFSQNTKKLILLFVVAAMLVALQWWFPKVTVVPASWSDILSAMSPEWRQVRRIEEQLSQWAAGLKKQPQAEDAATGEAFQITDVIDGDTIRGHFVKATTATETVRFIGINAPETGGPYRTKECFGEEAKLHLREVLNNKTVTLTADGTQLDRDKYGRLLRYVFLGDVNINEQMIADGFAHEYTYQVPYQHQKVFRSAQESARSAGKGLWESGRCGTNMVQ